jgi:tetratricopeptide (TPR) repeat protein
MSLLPAESVPIRQIRRFGNNEALRRTFSAAVFAVLFGVGLAASARAANEPREAQKSREAYLALKKEVDGQLKNAGQRWPRDPQKAEEVDRLHKALVSFQQAAKNSGIGLEAFIAVSKAYRNLGDLQRRLNDGKSAEKSYRTALAVMADVPAPPKGDADSVLELAACHNSLALSLRAPERAESLKHFRQAIDLLIKLTADNPKRDACRAELARSYHGLAQQYRASGELGAAQDNYRRALAIQSKLAEEFPDVARYRLSLAEIHLGMGDWLEGGHWSGNNAEEDSHVGKACKIMEGLVHDSPDDPHYRFRLAQALAALANMAGGVEPRIRDFNRAIDLLKKLREDAPRVPAYRSDLDVCYTNLGEIYWMCQDLDSAADFRKKALDLTREEAAEIPRNDNGSLANALHNWGEILICRGKLEEARKTLQESLEYSRPAHKSRPHSLYAASEVTATNFLVYATCTALKDDAGAAKSRAEAERVLDEAWGLLAADRGTVAAAQFCNDQAVSMGFLLDHVRGKGDPRLVNSLDGATIVVLAKAAVPKPDSSRSHTRFGWALGIKRRDLAIQVPALVSGDYRPANNRERLDMASECQAQKQYRLALTLYSDAFAAEPKSADDLSSGERCNAARAAAQLGCGGEANLTEAEQVRWRSQAREWLRADLALHARPAVGGQAGNADAAKQLRRWLQDADLKGVRDAARLKELPDAERKQWETFWSEVRTRASEAPAAK